MSGDVRIVKIFAEIENISQTRRITEYSCILSVPSACLTFETASYYREVKPAPPGRRNFRVSEGDDGAIRIIFAGYKVQLLSLDLGVDQLKMKGTWLEGDFEGTLADKVTVDAIVDGERLHVEKPIREIFEGLL